MSRDFFRFRIRASIYVALAGLFALMLFAIDFAVIPSKKHSAGFIATEVVLASLIFLCAYAGWQQRRSRR